MKEIDFIPEWYRAAQKRRRRYHHQYALLGILFLSLTVWSLVAGNHVRRAKAEVEAVGLIIETGQKRADEAAILQSEIDDIKLKTKELEAIAPRTKTSAVIAELSYIAGENIILSKLQLISEAIEMPAASVQQAQTGGVVRAEQMTEPAENAPAVVRTKAVLSGISAKPADAAELISKLEKSAYFEQVVPVFTRAKKVKDHEVTEFEICSYVADYTVE